MALIDQLVFQVCQREVLGTDFRFHVQTEGGKVRAEGGHRCGKVFFALYRVSDCRAHLRLATHSVLQR